MKSLHIDIQKRLDGERSLRLKLDLKAGELVAVTGPSGAGKTTLLRLLAGLALPDQGTISWGGQTWVDTRQKVELPAGRRSAGLVFQDYALFPHLTVEGNIRFAAAGGKSDPAIKDLMAKTGISHLADRRIGTLSGGQQQRVALARALAAKPSVLLLDEPLAALDASTRLELQDLILKSHRDFAGVTLMVSHDPAEILRMATYMIHIPMDGDIRHGTPAEVLGTGGLSHKFRVVGEVMDIRREDVICVISVMVGSQLLKVVATGDEASRLKTGMKVILADKAWNPVILPLEGDGL